MSPHLDILRTQARALPQCPGVYFWKDESDRILYIGKAVNIRSRVLSYFSAARHRRRTADLLSMARTVSCEVTSTELEALFRESTLIKRERPFFNRALLSQKKTWHIKLDMERVHPYLEIDRQAREDGSVYFGPFPTPAVARETLAFVHDVLPLRKCKAVKPRCKPCIYFQMHKCAAPMIDRDHQMRHEDAIDRLFDLLDGRHDRVVTWLKRKRERLSDSLLFEQAAEIQRRIDVLNDCERQYAMLRAALQCRCILVLDAPVENQPGRILLVAHGHVVSVRDTCAVEVEVLCRWVRAHAGVISAATHDQSELDAASVLQRWLRCKRGSVRWVALPYQPESEDLSDRVRYLLSDTYVPREPVIAGM